MPLFHTNALTAVTSDVSCLANELSWKWIYRLMVHYWFSSSPIGLSGFHVRVSTCSPTQNWASLVLLHSHTLIFLGPKRPLFGHSHLWTGVACRVHIVTGTAWLSKVKCCAQGSFRSRDLRTFCFYLINGSGSVYVSSMPSHHYLCLCQLARQWGSLRKVRYARI